jgi:hypothetical protein
MSIQFCVIKDTISNRYICHKEEVWGHGSTMTGPMSETVFSLEKLEDVMGTWTSDHFTMFEDEAAAKTWIKASFDLVSFIARHKKEVNLQVVTFVDLDAIVEKELLDGSSDG